MTEPKSDVIRILCVDDHPLLREGVAAVIEGESDMALVGQAVSGRDAVEKFKRLTPDVTLMDLRLPDMSGIEAIIAIRSERPAARVIVVTTHEGDAQALGALRAGALGYLLKGELGTDLLDTIRSVHAGKRRIPISIATDIAERSADDMLTKREIEVLRRVAAGKSNKLIASELSVSESTIKAHMKSILPKLNASDRTHAVMIAIKRGILEI